MTENNLKFLTLKLELGLKLTDSDPTYKTELAAITALGELTEFQKKELAYNLRGTLYKIARTNSNTSIKPILDTAKTTACVPESVLEITWKMLKLARKKRDEQILELREILAFDFPKETDSDVIYEFYSECTSVANATNDVALTTDFITKIKSLEGGAKASE